MMQVFLLLFSFTLPVMIVAFIHHTDTAATIAFATTLCFWATNEVARDIEDPFSYDPNELPISHQAHQINELIISYAWTRRPFDIFTMPEGPYVDSVSDVVLEVADLAADTAGTAAASSSGSLGAELQPRQTAAESRWERSTSMPEPTPGTARSFSTAPGQQRLPATVIDRLPVPVQAQWNRRALTLDAVDSPAASHSWSSHAGVAVGPEGCRPSLEAAVAESLRTPLLPGSCPHRGPAPAPAEPAHESGGGAGEASGSDLV